MHMRKIFLNKILFISIIILYTFIQNIVAQVSPSSITSRNKISVINKNWQQGGIFNGEHPEKEILAGRTEYTKKFDKGNGIIDMIFGGPFHYTDNKGAWQDINLDIKPQINGDYGYINDENKFISRFAQNSNDGVKMEYKNRNIEFGINTSVTAMNWSPAPSANPAVSTNENIIGYKNLYKNIDLEYELTTGAMLHRMHFNNKNVFDGLTSQQFIHVEETIELPETAVLADQSGKLNTNRKVNGNLFVIVNNDTLYTILAAHAWDASFRGDVLEIGKGNNLPNGVINIETNVSFISPTKFKLIASIPSKWLLVGNRVYPVVFDPPVSIGNLSSYSSNYRYPLNTCRLQRISQFLFLKNDINAGGINTTGSITDIAFYQDANNPMINNQVAISLKEVTENTFTGIVLETGLTQCFNPTNLSFTTGSPHWTNPLLFSSAFPYTNTKNLLIEVRFNNCGLTATSCPNQNTTAGGHAPGGQWGYYNSPYVGHRWQYSNSCTAPPSPVTSGTGIEDNPSYGYFIPATRITINTSGGCIPISISSNPGSQTVVAPAQAQFSVTVSGTTPSYQWQVSTNGGGGNWTNITPGSPYSGINTSQLTVNPTSSPMNGYQYRCIINGGTCTTSPVTSTAAVLTVNAAGCSTVLTPPASPNLPATGGGGSFVINVTPNSCSWSASANQTWITITPPLSGSGDATLGYTVSANNGPARNGIITVNGQNFTVNQQGVAAPTTYTISGRVIYQGSSTGIPGVTINTSGTGGGTTITDAQGYYTLPVSLVYSGTVSAVLQSFTFTPLSLPVSSLNYTNKNFDAPAVSIKISPVPISIMPPWQREGDDYNGTITVQIQNTGTSTNSWHLEANVFDANGLVAGGNIKFPSTNSTSCQFNTGLSSPPQNQQLKNLSKNGRKIEYVAVFDGDNNFRDTIRATNIIERKWDKKNIAYHNNGIKLIKFPLKYIQNISGVVFNFERSENTQATCSIHFFPCGQEFVYINNGGIEYAQYPNNQNENNRYLIIDPSDVISNLKTVEPGVFKYTFKYYSNFQVIESETGTFDLTKFGKVTFPNAIGYGTNASRVMVIIGGIINETEKNIQNINNYTVSSGDINPAYVDSKMDMSLISFFNSLGYNTWYIGQPNLNGVRQNAYDLGIAIDSIRRITGTIDINLICHSKGGLEIKALLGSNASNSSSLTKALDGTSYNYQTSPINNLIKKVAFLATPHQGSIIATLTTIFPGSTGCWLCSDGFHDLTWNWGIDPNHILNVLASTNMPATTKFLNLTAFGPSLTDFLPGTIFGDGAVNIPSSESFYPNNGNSFIQLYQDFSNHLSIHRNYVLSHFGECTTSSNHNIDYIYDFFRDNLSITCHRNLLGFYSIQTIKSILSNAKIRYKSISDSLYREVGNTDENGKLNFRLFDVFNSGDSVEISASGVDTQKIIVNSLFNNLHKLPIAMFASSISPNKVLYPSLSLVFQKPITNIPSIQIKVTAQKANQYFVNQHSSETIFIPINSGITTIPLDTGYNKVIVKFIGSDTVNISKDVYYLPDSMYTTFSTPFTVQTTSDFLGAKMFVNNTFYQDISNINSTIRLLNEVSEVKFSKYGYKDVILNTDSSFHIAFSMEPYSYSSLTDSTIFNFSNQLNPQYWKTLTVKNLAATTNKQLLVMQYDDAFIGMALKPQTRKFVFRKLGSAAPASFKTAIALDQIVTPDKDSVYLLYKNGNSWVKYPANQSGVSEYDPEVQKLAFDKLYIGDNETHEIVLMQKQAPIMKNLDTLWHSGQTIAFPLSIFVSDPDSIKNDLGITSTDAKVTVNGNIVYITAPVNFKGTTTYTITGIHDFLNVTRTYIMKVIPPEVYIPTAFTPNRDGVNDVLKPIFLGKLISCHFAIFNRNGQKVFETTDCTSGWDGRIKGTGQEIGTFVWMLSYQFEGEEKKEAKGTVVLIR